MSAASAARALQAPGCSAVRSTHRWDTYWDWGLLRVAPSARANGLLRKTLMLSGGPRVYYAAVVLNLAMRFSWLIWWAAVGLPTWRAGGGRQPWATVAAADTLVAVIEIARRCGWSLLRIEQEHVCNIEQCRAVIHVPLPKARRRGCALCAGGRAGGSGWGFGGMLSLAAARL